MKLIFAGTPEFAAQHLACLLNAGHQILAVYTQPDRPAGRGQRLHESPVKTLAKLHQLPVYQPEQLKTPESQAELAALEPDLMIVVAYGLLLPQAVLDIPRHGCLNVHASLLPRWRGAAPIQRAIAAGDAESGVCVMQMEAGLDTGPVLLERRLALALDETGSSLHDRLAQLGSQALLATLADFEALRSQAQPQDSAFSNYAHKISKTEAEIDWTRSAIDLERQIRAFNPFPVAVTRFNAAPLKIWQAELGPESDSSLPPGQILEISRQGILIATGQGSLRLTRVQPPGSRAMAIQDFLNGHAAELHLGQRLGPTLTEPATQQP